MPLDRYSKHVRCYFSNPLHNTVSVTAFPWEKAAVITCLMSTGSSYIDEDVYTVLGPEIWFAKHTGSFQRFCLEKEIHLQ